MSRVLIGLAVLVVVLSGCLSGVGDIEGEQDVLEAADSVNSYQYNNAVYSSLHPRAMLGDASDLPVIIKKNGTVRLEPRQSDYTKQWVVGSPLKQRFIIVDGYSYRKGAGTEGWVKDTNESSVEKRWNDSHELQEVRNLAEAAEEENASVNIDIGKREGPQYVSVAFNLENYSKINKITVQDLNPHRVEESTVSAKIYLHRDKKVIHKSEVNVEVITVNDAGNTVHFRERHETVFKNYNVEETISPPI